MGRAFTHFLTPISKGGDFALSERLKHFPIMSVIGYVANDIAKLRKIYDMSSSWLVLSSKITTFVVEIIAMYAFEITNQLQPHY